MSSSAVQIASIKIRPGEEAAFTDWQIRHDAALEKYPGFVSSDAMPAGSTESGEWSIVLKFRNQVELAYWQASRERAVLVAETLLFAEGGSFDEDISISDSGANSDVMITEVILSKVRPGHDSDYRAWTVRMQMAQAKYPGYQGMHLQPPVDAKTDHWTTLLAFDTMEHLQDWKNSPERAGLLREAKAFIESEELTPLTTSFPGWVPVNPRTGQSPPNWKTALLVLLGLYPAVVLELQYTYPLLAIFNPSIGIFLGNIGTVALTSFVTMPLFVRWFCWWLILDKNSPRSREWLGAGMIGALYLLEIASLWFLLFR